MPTRWVSFDCFGTLIDWHTGFARLVAPFAGERTSDVVRAYHEIERLIEAESPHRLYKDVLVTALRRAAEHAGVPLSESDARALPQAWGTLPVFADVEPMLAELRRMDLRLAVLTNCDDDLFAETQRAFRQPFDLVVTAEQVRAYKPALAHFQTFARRTNATAANWAHVACSWYHDIAPTRALGIRSVWLDREASGEDPAAATAHIPSAREVPAAIDAIFSSRFLPR